MTKNSQNEKEKFKGCKRDEKWLKLLECKTKEKNAMFENF